MNNRDRDRHDDYRKGCEPPPPADADARSAVLALASGGGARLIAVSDVAALAATRP